MSNQPTKVFISYAREDIEFAKWIHSNLMKKGIEPWMDKTNLLPGQKWKNEISKAIKNSDAFIAIISKTSVAKKGFVQKEIRYALEVLSEQPANKIYIIPARLDKTHPEFPEFEDISWVDMFDDRQVGMELILRSIELITSSKISTNKEKAKRQENPMVVFLKNLPDNSDRFLDSEPVYITFKTNLKGVILTEALSKKYPGSMMIVLQYQYEDLIVENQIVSVTLWFSGIATKIAFPIESIEVITQGDVNLMQ